MRDSQSDDDGVIGYQVTTVTTPNIPPIAVVVLPSMMILPAVLFIRSMRQRFWRGRFAFAYSMPLSIAATFGSIAICLPLNCFVIAARFFLCLFLFCSVL